MITIQSHVVADRSTVWKCYTDPAHIVNWNAASDDWCCPHASNDCRVGGLYRARMESKDQSMGFDFEGTYYDVVEGERLAYTIADGRDVQIMFATMNGATQVTIQFEAETMNPEDLQRQGWQAILDRFKLYTEKTVGERP